MLVEKEQFKIISDLLADIYCDYSSVGIEKVSLELIQIIKDKKEINRFNSEKRDFLWDSSTVVLITYPDGVFRKGQSTLKTLSELIDKKIGNLSQIIHVLPFLESTSDGGFAVSSHEKLESRFGDWKDLRNLSENHYLMADLVLNHVSSSHPWVQEFIQYKSPGNSYILSPIEINGWESVVRPRSSSLFTQLSTVKGMRKVWTTFGPDQIDLDWHNPYILIEFFKLSKLYFDNGVRWIRLDAVAFIWKELNTSCLHRIQVHKIVKLLRFLLEQLHSKTVVITETNVPEGENISYLTSGDEAHLAYNFPLPPLLLESLLTNKSDLLNKWLCNWPSLPNNASFLNFTASHDGIGLRALEGLMDKARFHGLLVNCEKRGGLISHRKMANGEDRPYELNISWWSAMADGGLDPSYLQISRFLLSQIFIMSLQGVPAFYLQAILASENDIKNFGISGERRDLNRERFDLDKLLLQLEDTRSSASQILTKLNLAMEIRSKLEAFNPYSPMKCLTKNRSDLVIILRGSGENKVLAIHNMTSMRSSLSLSDPLFFDHYEPNKIWHDYLNNNLISGSHLELLPYDVKWIKRFK